MKTRILALTFFAVCAALFGSDKKPLTNLDIIKMVKAELPESTILMTIQANPQQFDSSVDAVLELKSQSVSPAVIEAMLRGVAGPANGSSAGAAEPPATSADASREPRVSAIEGGARTALASKSFRIVETKAKGSTLASLSSDSSVTSIANDVLQSGALNMLGATGGKLGGTLNAVSGLASVGKKLFKSDEVTLTYVYALDGAEAARKLLGAAAPQFEIDFGDIPGTNPDEFEPALIKLSPTPKNWRMVGAMKAKKSEFNEATPRELNIIEERVPASVKRLARGRAEISPAAAPPPGEYAIVLRPVAAAKKKFMLQEIEQNQGEASVLRLVWDFKVAAAP